MTSKSELGEKVEEKLRSGRENETPQTRMIVEEGVDAISAQLVAAVLCRDAVKTQHLLSRLDTMCSARRFCSLYNPLNLCLDVRTSNVFEAFFIRTGTQAGINGASLINAIHSRDTEMFDYSLSFLYRLSQQSFTLENMERVYQALDTSIRLNHSVPEKLIEFYLDKGIVPIISAEAWKIVFGDKELFQTFMKACSKLKIPVYFPPDKLEISEDGTIIKNLFEK